MHIRCRSNHQINPTLKENSSHRITKVEPKALRYWIAFLIACIGLIGVVMNIIHYCFINPWLQDISLFLPGKLDSLLLLSHCSCSESGNHTHGTNTIQYKNYLHFIRHISDQILCRMLKHFIIHGGFRKKKHGEDNRIHSWSNFCERYRKYRCHIRMDQVHLPRVLRWNQAHMIHFSIHSDDRCNFVEALPHDTSIHSHDSQSFNTLQTHVLPDDDSMMPLPPVVDIRQLSINWNSWKQPVIDVNASGIVLHVVVTSSVHSHTMKTRSHSHLSIPSILLGNSTLPQVLQAIPPPPKEVGHYPRMGKINITDVKVHVYGHASKSHEDYEDVIGDNNDDDDDVSVSYDFDSNYLPIEEKSILWTINIPDEVFLPLLQVSMDAGPNGIDQLDMSSVIVKALGTGYWNHIIQEEQKKLDTMLNKSIEAFDTWFAMIRTKIHEGSQVIDSQVDKITTAIEFGLEQIMGDENNPFGKLLMDWRRKWDDFSFPFEFRGVHFLQDTFEVSEWSNLWDEIGRNISQGWEDLQRIISTTRLTRK